MHEPYLFAPQPDGDDRKVVTWSSRERTHAQLRARLVAGGRRRLRARGPSAGKRPPRAPGRCCCESPDRERWLAAVGPEILDGSIADDLAGIPSEAVRVPFAIQGLIGTLAGPQDPGTAFVGFFHDLGEAAEPPGAWGFARGGMGAVTQALRAAARGGGRARAHRGAGRAGAARRADGAAGGVVLEDGEEVRARAVLSNADPLRTAALAGVPRRPAGARPGPVVKVMLLLDGLPDFPSWPGPEPWAGTIDIGFTLDDLAAAAADARAGRPAARPWIEAACQTAADPTLAPDGPPRALAVLPVLPRRTSTPRPRPTRRSPASPRSAPGCRTAIVDRLALGPRELEARFGITGGHIFHGEMLARQLLERRFGPRAFARRSRASTWRARARTRAAR